MAGFCPNCGTPATDDAVFCTGCGTKLAEATAIALGKQASARTGDETAPGTIPGASAHADPPVGLLTSSATVSTGTPTPVKSGGCGKEMLIIGLVFALLVVAGVGIAIYLAHQTR